MMKKYKIISFIILLFSTLLYFIILNYKIYNGFSFLLITILLGIAIFIGQNKNYISSNFLFYIFFLYSVGLGPVILLNKGIEYNYDYFTIILGGLLAFSWGSNFFQRNDGGKRIIDNNIINFAIPRIVIVRILYIISLVASFIYIHQNKNLLFGGNIQSGRVDAMSGNGMILYTMQLPIILVPLFYEIYLANKEMNNKSISKIELIIIFLLSSFTLLFSGFRSPLISMYVCLLFIYLKKNNKSIISCIPYGLLLIVGVEGLGILRNVLSGGTSSRLIESLNNNLIVNCINLKYIFATFPTRVGFQHGYTYLINLLMLIPGPDLDFTLWLKEQLNLSFMGGGVTPTILGEFYINFGILSIYYGMFLLAIIGNYITNYFDLHSNSFLGALLVWQYAHCVSGGIANVIILIILFSIVYWFVLMFPIHTRRNRA